MAEDRKRLILPAPSSGSFVTGSASQSSKRDSATRISTACEACKRRKSRCVGRPPPCQMCKTCGTECIIDATLDQRRKVSAKRLAEQAEVQRELLLAVIQCVRHGKQDDVQELVRCFRDGESRHVTSAFLRQASTRFVQHRREGEASLDSLLDSFSTILRGKDGAEDAETTVEARKQSLSTREQPGIKTEHLMFDHNTAETPESPSPNSPRQALRQTYSRWAQYFRMPHPTASGAGLEWTAQHLDTAQHRGQHAAQAVMTQSPGLVDHSAFSSSYGDRSLWHPVLRLVSSSEATTPTSASMTEVDEEHTYEANVWGRAQRGQSSHVEILRSFPSSMFSQPTNASLDAYTCELKLSRHAIHSVQPVNNLENSPLSRIILDFRDAGRKLISSGNPVIEVLGKDGIVVDLLFRERALSDDFSVSNWASEIWRGFDDWDIYVRLAQVLFFTYLMRWNIFPTAEQYSHIPETLRPSPMQCLVPHHAAIDFIPFPVLRDALIRNFRDWMTTFSAAGISVNWSHGLERAIYQDANTGQVRITAAFAHHVIDTEHWSLGKSALAMFPELEHAGVLLLDGR